jgi:ABC-type multidrug transport system fused ATPase/permease subunit
MRFCRRLGSSGYLQDSDVYTLSPTQRSKPLYAAFQRIAASSLLRKMLKTNGLDLFLDAALTAVSVVLNYSSPYFIKKIIEALTAPTPESIAKAYTYALLAFLATLAKAQCDLNHLWFSRRAAVRVKSTLTSAIYEKALLRVDKSGVGESKGTAGVGKVVNLMAGDTNRISNQVSSLYMLYASPFELLVCCTFLYSVRSWRSNPWSLISGKADRRACFLISPAPRLVSICRSCCRRRFHADQQGHLVTVGRHPEGLAGRSRHAHEHHG